MKMRCRRARRLSQDYHQCMVQYLPVVDGLYNLFLAFILLVMPPWMLYNFYLFPDFEHSCSCTTQDHTHMDDLMNKCATTLLLHYSIPKISHMRSSPPIWVQLPAPNLVNGNIQKALGMPRGQTTESTFQYPHL